MQRFWETVFDTLTGAAIKGAQVWLFHASDNSAAPIYSDKAGTLDAGNPLTSDSNGFVEGYLADGLYNIEFRFDGVLLRTITDVPIYDLGQMRTDVDTVLAALPNKLDRAAVSAFGFTLIDVVDAAAGRLVLDIYSKEEIDAALATVGGVVSAITQYYHYGAFAVASILASEVLMDHQVASTHTLAANFVGSLYLGVGTPPAADFAIAVLRNGGSIGTITVHTDGTWTGATAGALAISANDTITAVAPAGVDAALARLRFTFKGTM